MLSRLRAAIDATQEERRFLASQYDLRGRAMKKADRERQRVLWPGSSACSRRCTHRLLKVWSMRRSMRSGASVEKLRGVPLLALAGTVGVSLAVGLCVQAKRSSCGITCGFMLAPTLSGSIDALAAASHASEISAAAEVVANATMTNSAETSPAAAAANVQRCCSRCQCGQCSCHRTT